MHICYITGEYPINGLSHGGVGTFTRSLGYKLIENNVQVSVVRLANVKQEEKIIDNGVVVYLIPEEKKLPFKFIWNSFKINKKIKEIHLENHISIVETPELGLAFLNKIKGIKYIIRMHGGHHFFAKAENRKTEWKKVWQEKKSFKKADYVVAVSKYVAETTKNILKLKDLKVQVIYNSVDTSRFYQSDIEKVEPHTLFFAGSIIEKKGIRQLIQSLEYLVDIYPDIKLKIAGRDATIPGTNEPYRPILEKAITKKISSHIEFLGAIPNFEIPQHIERAHICCYPSHMEAMPLAWLEVLAMGKIFIGSETGPGPEAVQNDVTGFLVNPHDPESIAKKIICIFENTEKAIQIGKNARNYVLQYFEISKIVSENLKFYNEVIR